MLRLRTLSWLVICALVATTLAPALPAHATARNAITAPTQQDDELADHIAEIRNQEPDIEEDFATATGLFNVGYDGTTAAYFKSGELRVTVDDENTLAWATLDQEVGDFYVEVDTIHREGALDNQYGFLARFDEEDNYYLFAASSDGYYTIQTFVDDEWEAIIEWEESDAIEIGEGELNVLGLLAEGDTYTFLINDTIIDSVTDDTLTGSVLALNAAAFSTPPIEIGFDNFRLWHLGDYEEPGPRQAPVDGRRGIATPTPTAEVTEEATAEPTSEPTSEPTAEATAEVTEEATSAPTEEATAESTPVPTEEPTDEPIDEPTVEATAEPTAEPTAEATVITGSSDDPTIAAIQAQPPTFSDDFADGDVSDWINFETDTVVYEPIDGAFEFVFSTPNVLVWSELPVRATNYYIEVDATLAAPIEAAEYGILFNYVDSQNFYLYAVNNASRYSVWRLVNNSWEVVRDWVEAPALLIDEGNTNRLGLLVDDTTIVLSANNQVLATIDNSEAAAGGVALAAGTFEEANLVMRFDNVLLWDLDALAEAPTPEPTPEPTEEPTEEPTPEPTDEPVSAEFAEIAAQIEAITANAPDFTDDFRRNNGTWDTTSHEQGASFYESRLFHIEAYAEESTVWSAHLGDETTSEPIQYGDFYVEFDTSFVIYTGENSAGLVFRLSDDDNYYKFMLDEIGYFQVQKRVDGESIDLTEWTVTDAVDASEGATNRIGVLVEGSSLAFTVNGTVIAQVEDSDLTSGALALAIQTYASDEGESTFDNLELWNLSE